MKLTEFRDLCKREWGEARGDVIGLCLTDESAAELRRDVIMDGRSAFSLPNPVTRSDVRITKGAGSDAIEVRRYYAEPHPACLS